MASETWDRLEPAWQRSLTLAWEALRAGSVGVGAVITDPSGDHVAEGRNRWHETAAGSDPLAGSRIAHAELNALAKIPTAVDLDDYVLWTTFEPCLQCGAAALQSRVGTIRYLASDPLWHGVDQVVETNAFVAERWPRRVGPDPTWAGSLAAVLGLYRSAIDKPDGVLMTAVRSRDPAAAELIDGVVAAGTVDAALAGGWTVAELAARLGDR